jgi:hypothetical protein
MRWRTRSTKWLYHTIRAVAGKCLHYPHLLFMHWPVHPAVLRPYIPRILELETFDGTAWLGITPFRMQGARPRLVPPLPGVSVFPELNVRTYVTAEGKPGVWFFSLDAANPFAVRASLLQAKQSVFSKDLYGAGKVRWFTRFYDDARHIPCLKRHCS